MNTQYNPKLATGCLTIYVIIILVVSYRVTSSLNPFAVYTGESLWAKIAIAIFSVLIVIGLLQMGMMHMTRSIIARTAKKPAEDVICPGCGRPLLQYSGAYGNPMRCPRCGQWWHNGPACYNKVAPGTSMIHFCPKCISELSGQQDLFDDNAFSTTK